MGILVHDVPIKKRVFPFRLASWLPSCYTIYLHWLRYLLERLGRQGAFSIWQDACQDYDDGLTVQILSTGWSDIGQNKVLDVQETISSLFSRFFPVPVERVSMECARQIIEKTPPIDQIKKTFASYNVCKSMTAYEALHLRFDASAKLVEALIRLCGKQGELIAYDVLREQRVIFGGGKTGSIAEFITDYVAEAEEPNLFTAGLRIEWVRPSEQEVLLKVKECEWARYFRERHPQVGYLMACSTDEVAYRAFNKDMRIQRTATLMEGGEVCDFRIYTVGEASEWQ